MHVASRRKWCAAGVMAILALTGGSAQAQESGAVRGTVTLIGDAGPVHGALVLVVGTGATALTEEDGTFEIPNVPIGAYEVLAQREHLTAGRQPISVVAGEVATVDFELAPSPVHEDVTVTASAGGAEPTFEAFNAVTTLDSFDLVQVGQGSLGDALQNEPGIASRSFGPGSSRPIIRGFDGDRVLILQDGIRTGDLSSQSGDHGVTIDPNNAERIEIVRGPATLLYGSNAVGGLVNIITPQESLHESMFDGTRAQISTDGGSANRQAGVNLSVQHAQGNVRFWAGGSTRRTGDYDTPEGRIANSATELTNANAGVGYDNDRFFASGGFTFEEGRYGVPFAEEFHGAHGHGHGEDDHDEDDHDEDDHDEDDHDEDDHDEDDHDEDDHDEDDHDEDDHDEDDHDEDDHDEDDHDEDDHDDHGEDDHDEDDHDEDDHGDEEIDLASRRRAGRFDIGLRNLDNSILDGLRVTLNVIEWNHDELEVADGLENVGTSFANQSYIVRAELEQQQTERVSGRFGMWAKVRNFEATGFEALAPRTDQTAFAAFAYEELSFGRFRLQFGGRVERNAYRAGERAAGIGHEDDHDEDEDDHDHDEDEDDHDHDEDEDDHDHDEDEDDHDHDEDDHDEDDHDEDDHDEDDHDEDDHDHDEDEDDHDHDEDEHVLVVPDPRDRQFLGASASIGIHADLGANTAFVANFTHSHRAPALEELYNFGPHIGNLAFEVGNPNLDSETTLGLDVSLRTRAGRVRSELNGYVYDIDGFIFGDRTDELRDNLPVLDFTQGDSRFVGFDARGSLRLAGQAWATLGIGYVDAKLTATNEPLPRIPPLRGTLTLDVPYGGFTLSPQIMYAARQDAVFRGETETAGYSVLNVHASYTWPRQHAAHVVTFTGYNLTNTTYRNHTSFIKDLAPEMGRGIRVGYSLRFF